MNGPMALYGGDVPIFVTSQSVKPATSYYYSIKPFIAALKVTTRTELKVECGFYNSTAENNGRILNSLRRFLSNVRRREENINHSTDYIRGWRTFFEIGMLNVFDSFMIAAKVAGSNNVRTVSTT